LENQPTSDKKAKGERRKYKDNSSYFRLPTSDFLCALRGGGSGALSLYDGSDLNVKEKI
jgi:hypothetical protein